MRTKDITVIITTFKSDEKITSCLDSINKEIKVIIIENSLDESFKEKVEKLYLNVECIIPSENLGYAKGNNLGLKKVKTKYALVLNPDTIIKNDSINNFLNSAEKNDFTLMGPFNDQKLDFKDKKDIIRVPNLKGFAIFFNMSKFRDLDFFDENYFLYFEEIDLCKRVEKNKGKIYINPKINIEHLGASSVSRYLNDEIEKNRNWHWMWSTFYFHKKHKGFLLALIIILPKLLSSFFKIFIYMLILNKEKHSIYVCRLSGIFNSIIGKKSWYRPSID